MYCEDIQNMDLTNALQSLMALFVEHISTLSADITSVLKSKVTEWIASQVNNPERNPSPVRRMEITF